MLKLSVVGGLLSGGCLLALLTAQAHPGHVDAQGGHSDLRGGYHTHQDSTETRRHLHAHPVPGERQPTDAHDDAQQEKALPAQPVGASGSTR